MISLLIYNKSSYKITLPLRLLDYCETNATISITKEIAYRVKKEFTTIRYMSINSS